MLLTVDVFFNYYLLTLNRVGLLWGGGGGGCRPATFVDFNGIEDLIQVYIFFCKGLGPVFRDIAL